MSEILEYVVYNQCYTNVNGRFYRSYGTEGMKKLQDIPLNKWKKLGDKYTTVHVRRKIDVENSDFNAVQLIHIMLREKETKDILVFLKSIEPVPFFRDSDCNKWKSVNVHHSYISHYVSGGQFTGQSEINNLIEPYNMSFAYDYEGEADHHIQFPQPVSKIPKSKTQEVFEDALKRLMYLEAFNKFLIRGIKIEALKLGKLFLDTNKVLGKPIIPSLFDE